MAGIEYEKYLQEFKDHCHVLNNDDDSNFKTWIPQAHAYVMTNTGQFDFENQNGLLLVKECVRFIRNGQLEFFKESFDQEISDLSWELYKPSSEVSTDATTT